MDRGSRWASTSELLAFDGGTFHASTGYTLSSVENWAHFFPCQAVAITKELLKAGPANLKMLTDKDSNIALMIAIDAGNGPLCRELLSGEDASEQICRTKV